MNWYLMAWKKFAVFSGRSRRKEYWMFVLINLIISFILTFIDRMLGFGTIDPNGVPTQPILSSIYSLAILVPSIAVTVRRLHDIGKSGWWILIGLIPLIGMVVLIVFACFDSEEGDNRFGPNPKTGAPQPGSGPLPV
ncbi:DUF805 domain-containing protein [Minwuia sp.]|uniref:DUF805 domain-containing protein n=1 Tax=Minwuia sp. TaxID=2493630 RepID=UPI003A95469A